MHRLLVAAALIFASASLQAKELAGRFGFGIQNLGPGMTPSLSVDWQLSPASATEFLLALDSGDDSSFFDIGARFSRNLFVEELQQFYLFVGAGLSSHQVDGQGQSGNLLEGGAGSRFFLADLPNLGLSFGGGFQLVSREGVRFGSRVFVGAHYYF